MLFVFWLVSTLFVGLMGAVVASVALARSVVPRMRQGRANDAADAAWNDVGGISPSTAAAAS